MGRKVINLEEEEDEMDERTARRWRRRCIANGIYEPDLQCSTTTKKKSTKCNDQVENPMLDKDYKKFLSSIEDGGEWNEHSSDHSVDIGSVDEGDRADGLNDDGGNQHASCEIIDTRSVDDAGSERSVDDKVDLNSVDDGDDQNGQCGDDDVDMKSADDGDARNVHFGDGNLKGRSVDDDDDMDTQYKFFWDNLREDGNSYVLEMVQEDGS